jgi:hypothetical protein
MAWSEAIWRRVTGCHTTSHLSFHSWTIVIVIAWSSPCLFVFYFYAQQKLIILQRIRSGVTFGSNNQNRRVGASYDAPRKTDNLYFVKGNAVILHTYHVSLRKLRKLLLAPEA